MKTITVLIETYNEETNLHDCIRSAKLLTDAILVVDMNSTDKTVEIAQRNGAKVLLFDSPARYVEPAREFGIRKVTTEWVMILDADERITKNLAEEIHKKINKQDFLSNRIKIKTHFKIPRKNIFAGKKWLKHGGWWPDEQIRLIHIPALITWPARIHSTPVVDGEMGHFNEPLLHYFHGDLHTMVEKTITFENIEADLLFKANRLVAIHTFFRKFYGELYRRLLKHKGYKDGIVGIIESIYQAFSKTITYLFLYEKKRRPLQSIP